MKNLMKYFFLISMMLILFGVYSCTKMDHYYKDLIIERTYVGTADSMWVFAGDERMQLNWLTPTDPSAQTLVVLWNNGRDSAETPINHGIDTGRFIVEGLPEGPLTFYVVTKNNDGERSVGKEMTTEIFGDIYKNRLSNRGMNYWLGYDDSIVTYLIPSGDPSLLFSIIEFTDKDGGIQSARMPSNQTAVALYNIDVSKSISVSSGFYPGNNVIDTFYSPKEVFDLDDFRAMYLDVPSDATTDLIDFNLMKVYTYSSSEVANVPEDIQKTIDLGHLRGGGSKHNFYTMTSSRPSAFSDVLYSGLTGFAYRNVGSLVDLGISSTIDDFYDNLDENDRDAMISAYNQAASTYGTADAVWPINTGQVLFLKSANRDIYVAIRAADANPDGPIRIQFKISRP